MDEGKMKAIARKIAVQYNTVLQIVKSCKKYEEP
jgi:hypothetical protein